MLDTLTMFPLVSMRYGTASLVMWNMDLSNKKMITKIIYTEM